jgi:hypothetical protein
MHSAEWIQKTTGSFFILHSAFSILYLFDRLRQHTDADAAAGAATPTAVAGGGE